MAGPHCKGIALIHLRDFVETKHGAAGLAKVKALLKPEVAQALDFPNAPQWYPMQWIVDADVAVCDALYGGDYAQGYRIGAYDLDRSVRTVYKIIVTFLETTFLLKRAAKLWSSYYDRGVLEVTHQGSAAVTVQLRNFNPMHECLCHVLRGAFAGALQACGAKSVELAHPRCVLKGAPACVFDATWKP